MNNLAKLILTNNGYHVNVIIELNDGSQIEVDVSNLIESLKTLENENQVVIEAIQIQP